MSLTASQEVLLGAAELHSQGFAEFSEWDLTVAVWKRNRNKFGCRGYEDKYPDHKRVMMEIMSREKKDNPLRRGWFEKTRPNFYKITNLGLSEATRLEHRAGDVTATLRSPDNVYEVVAPYVNHRVFKDFCRNSDEPSTWLGASSFLGITKNDPIHLEDQIRKATGAAEQATLWFDENGQDSLRRGPSGGGMTIRRQEVKKLHDLLVVIKDRFRLQLDAIRKRGSR